MRFMINDTQNFFVDFDKAYISPPAKLPWYIKLGAWLSRKILKKDLMIPKILAHYPKAAISSGILESLVAHDDKEVTKRMLKIIRVQVSILVACPFCIDMNAFEYEKANLTRDEIESLQHHAAKECPSFSLKEQILIEYINLVSATPIIIPKEMITRLKEHFSDRAIVIIATTIAQVHYWARFIRSVGIPVAGFGDICTLESNATFHTNTKEQSNAK